VFKVFVANPQKPTAVIAILKKNREKLIGYLANFQNDREDEQFARRKPC
jgi:calcium binding protein 39